MPSSRTHYLILDEVSYIKEWDKGVKYLADSGVLDEVVLMLSGSDLVLIREARMRLPGQRGAADTVDFHMYPLTFPEVLRLRGLLSSAEHSLLLERPESAPLQLLESLFFAFEGYLRHGGFLPAINDVARDLEQGIQQATFQIYSDWIRGDVLERGKQEHNLRDLLQGILRRYLSQITWNSLAGELIMEHPATIADYVALLESMDVLTVQYALREDKLSAAPKKARRVIFNDPFILHAVQSWLDPSLQSFHPLSASPKPSSEWDSRLVETCAINHFSRKYPTFYIKGRGEVDIAYLSEGKFWPVEVKWTTQTRPADLKQLSRYDNGLILDRFRMSREILGIPTVPLPLALLMLEHPEGPLRGGR